MSHFYGTLQGSRGQATRCGTKNSGVRTIAASWQGAIETELYWDEEEQKNKFRVVRRPWHGAGYNAVIAEGEF